MRSPLLAKARHLSGFSFGITMLAALGCQNVLLPVAPHAVARTEPHGPPLQICWLEYTHHDLPAGYSLAGHSSRDHWVVTASGLLIRHPKGHLLVDVGNSTKFEEELGGTDFVARQFLKAGPGGVRTEKTATAALAELGETPSQLKAVVLSHAHPDHAGGLDDLPNVPVILAREELDFTKRLRDARSFAVVREHAMTIEPRAQPLLFRPSAYENFDASFDYFGDGSVVFVPLFGHTPGSIGTFVNRNASDRLIHVGDATNSTEAIERRVGKSFALEWTDYDPWVANAVVAKLSQLHEAEPALRFVPAHDRDAWLSIFPKGPGTCVGP